MGHAAFEESQRLGKVSYGTEAGLFQKMGVPTVICGPGDIAQAHGPNEFVSLEQLAQCERFMDRISKRDTQRDAGHPRPIRDNDGQGGMST